MFRTFLIFFGFFARSAFFVSDAMLLISYNVAGWNTTLKLIRENYGSLSKWLDRHGCDILCLQEVKARCANISDEPGSWGAKEPGWEVRVLGMEQFTYTQRTRLLWNTRAADTVLTVAILCSRCGRCTGRRTCTPTAGEAAAPGTAWPPSRGPAWWRPPTRTRWATQSSTRCGVSRCFSRFVFNR